LSSESDMGERNGHAGLVRCGWAIHGAALWRRAWLRCRCAPRPAQQGPPPGRFMRKLPRTAPSSFSLTKTVPTRARLGSGDRRTNRAMRTACALLWCSLRSAIGAANLQDHSEAWAAAGLADQLVQASLVRARVRVGVTLRGGARAAAVQWLPRPTLPVMRQAYVDVLPAALFEAVQHEAAAVVRESAKGDAFKFGKRTTWWLPLRAKDGAPIASRSAIEAAVHALHRQAFGGVAVDLIVGAEWWVQEQQSHADIGFHYDKEP
jgi:hypothetical protein